MKCYLIFFWVPNHCYGYKTITLNRQKNDKKHPHHRHHKTFHLSLFCVHTVFQELSKATKRARIKKRKPLHPLDLLLLPPYTENARPLILWPGPTLYRRGRRLIPLTRKTMGARCSKFSLCWFHSPLKPSVLESSDLGNFNLDRASVIVGFCFFLCLIFEIIKVRLWRRYCELLQRTGMLKRKASGRDSPSSALSSWKLRPAGSRQTI